MTIDYVSLAGLEGYLAQESHGCGRAGTAYVGLFNGNLVVAHQDTNMNGSLMPFSVTRYYNSCYRDVNPFGAGYGWKYSSQQTLHQETIGSVLHYVYMDGDGTRHHFKQTSGTWNDLSGLSLKLTFSGSTATITDKGDNTMTFDKPTAEFNNNYGNVKMIKTMADAQGNTITFTHNSSRLTTAIKDGANRTTSMTATSIAAPDMNAVTSVLTSNKLTNITHEDGKYVQYAYDSSTGLLNKMTNHDNSSLEFTYTSQAPYRVTLVTYKDKNGTVCGGRKYEYGDCRTTVTEMIPNESVLVEGKTLVYHFNDAGNVVSVNDGLGYGCFAGYSASMPLNHPEYTSKMQRAVNNYLKNHNFLSVNTDWTSQNLNGAAGSGAYNSDEIYAGGRAYKLSKTNASGQVTVYQNVTLAKNKTYTFSCYYKTAGSSSVQIRAEYKNSSGTTVYAESATAVSTDRWDRIFVPFTVPSNSTSTTVTIRMMAVGGSGSVWVDAAQVEDGPVANRYNLMQNGAFTMNSSGVPTGWSAGAENVAADDCLVSGSAVISGRPTELTGNVLRLKGAPGKDKYFYQYFSCMGNAGDTYVAGGWSANYSRPRFDTATGVPCLYQMEVLARATSDGNYVSAGKVRWSDEWSGWHFAAIPVVMPVNYSDVRIILTYRNSLNEAQFSNLFLHREEFGKTFAYDSKGNVTSVKNLAALQSYATYDSFNNMLTYRQPGRPSSAQYTQTWGSTDAEKKKHLLRTSKSPLSIWQEYGYDSKGNPTSAKTRNGSSSLVIGSTTAYNDATYPNYVASQTDARGKTVTTVTDANKGTVTSVTDPNSQTVSYTYDSLKRNTAVSTTVSGSTYKNNYTYTGDLLTQVKHNTDATTGNDVSYNFAFDSQNRPTTVKVGTQTLSTNTYNTAANPTYGTLQKVTYGNSTSSVPQSVAYEYDDFKRVTKVTVDGSSSKTYQFYYGANGQVAKLVDSILNRVVYSEYDVENRPMRITTMEDTSHVYTGQVWYDEYNNLKTFKEWVGTGKTQFRTDFTYDTENKPTKLTYGDNSNKVEYEYDGIGRVYTRTVTAGGGAYGTSYSYLAGSHNGSTTTGLISGITQTGENFTYTYDNVGNISSVTQNSKTTYYVYDNLGQLIRVNDQNDPTSGTAGTTWVYTYDLGGNIKTKKRYDYTTGTVGTVRETVSFTYGDSNWKDELTQYSVQVGTNPATTYTVTSDVIGNPTSDGTWSYTWEKGRQLKQMSKTGTTATFKYNSEGLRVKKTVNSTVTNYTLHGKNIVHLTQGSNTLHFWYDAQNRPAIVEWNNGTTTTKYAYIHNLQGDIVGIIDSSGNEVVKYTYDAWGKVLSTTGSLAGTLGTIQPFRYRGYVYDIETGLYYLRSRYYNPSWNRFVNADYVIEGNSFEYCDSIPTTYNDESGTSKVSVLNEICDQFCAGEISSVEVAKRVFTNNGFGIYTAFHEIAQIHAAKYIRKYEPDAKLEVPVGFLRMEMDIASTNYVWEVKNKDDWGLAQVFVYSIASGKDLGFGIRNIKDIYVTDFLQMEIYSDFFEPGTVHYRLYNKDLETVKNALAYSLIIGLLTSVLTR